MPEIEVNVTAEDIANGSRADCYYCPIATALSRQIPNIADLYVLYSVAYFRKLGALDYQRIYLPKKASDFITAYDNDKTPRPFKFRVEVNA